MLSSKITMFITDHVCLVYKNNYASKTYQVHYIHKCLVKKYHVHTCNIVSNITMSITCTECLYQRNQNHEIL